MIKFFSKMKLHSKLTLSHIILIAIPTIVIAGFFITNLFDMAVSNTIRQEHALADQTSLTLDSTLQQVDKVSNSINDNGYLVSLLSPKSDNYGSMLANQTEEKAKLLKSIQSLIDDDLITDVKIYSNSIDKKLYSDPYTSSIFSPLESTNGTYWKGIFAGSDKKELYCPSFYLSPKELKQSGTLAYIRKVTNKVNALVETSYVAVYFSATKLNSILEKNISVNNGVSYIINERNSIVAASNYSLAGTYFTNYDQVVKNAISSTGFVTRTVLDKDVYIGCYNIKNTDWYMVSILPTAPILNKGISIIRNFAILYLVMLLVAFLLASNLSNSITNRLSVVCKQMRNVRKGKIQPMDAPTVHDEIGDLVDDYNYMSNEMNKLLDEQAKAAENLRISEFRALQAQINPHFLYNTMDMINWKAKSGKNEEVSKAVQALSRFYKLTLSKKSILTSIEAELEHVSLYVELQNMRYQDKIELVIDVPFDMYAYAIPKLTYQPIVENAIIHGILETEEKAGTIVITGWQEGTDLLFLISDDGVGMSENTIKNILSGNKGNSKSKGTSIGVYNTHLRLRTLYGKSYGLTYSSKVGLGTEVLIKLPIHATYEFPTDSIPSTPV